MIPLADQHTVTYFKRFKMEMDLHNAPAVPPLTDGYRWIAPHATARRTVHGSPQPLFRGSNFRCYAGR